MTGSRQCSGQAAVSGSQVEDAALRLEWAEADGHVYMTGPATEVFEGEWPV